MNNLFFILLFFCTRIYAMDYEEEMEEFTDDAVATQMVSKKNDIIEIKGSLDSNTISQLKKMGTEVIVQGHANYRNIRNSIVEKDDFMSGMSLIGRVVGGGIAVIVGLVVAINIWESIKYDHLYNEIDWSPSCKTAIQSFVASAKISRSLFLSVVLNGRCAGSPDETFSMYCFNDKN